MSEKSKCLLPEDKCKQLMDRVLLALDGALTREEEKDVFCEVEQYPCCLEKLKLEKEYRNMLVKSCKCKQVPDDLIVNIKQQVALMASQGNFQ